MKKNNWWKIIILTLAIITCLSIPIILYFIIGQDDTSNSNNKINLDKKNISYFGEVQHMVSPTETEAIIIKNGIQEKINEKMNNLNLEVETDYTINNLDTIKARIPLDSINITVNSVETSLKVIGSLTVILSFQEDINDRSIETITIPARETDNLSASRANLLRIKIPFAVQDVLNEGQFNKINIDYQIVNLESIIAGAKFENYNNIISVKGISAHLKGSFMINFQINK